MFEDIPRNVQLHSPECLTIFPGIFGDIPRNITFPPFPHSVLRSCIPGFIHNRHVSTNDIIDSYIFTTLCKKNKKKTTLCNADIFRTLLHQDPGISRTLTYSESEAFLEPCYIQNPVAFRTRGIFRTLAAQKMKFSINDFFSKCYQIHRKLQIWSHLLKNHLMENFLFCAVAVKHL